MASRSPDVVEPLWSPGTAKTLTDSPPTRSDRQTPVSRATQRISEEVKDRPAPREGPAQKEEHTAQSATGEIDGTARTITIAHILTRSDRRVMTRHRSTHRGGERAYQARRLSHSARGRGVIRAGAHLPQLSPQNARATAPSGRRRSPETGAFAPVGYPDFPSSSMAALVGDDATYRWVDVNNRKASVQQPGGSSTGVTGASRSSTAWRPRLARRRREGYETALADAASSSRRIRRRGRDDG